MKLKEEFKEVLMQTYGGVVSPGECADHVADELVHIVLSWIIPIQTDCLVSAIKKLQETDNATDKLAKR